MSPRQALYSCCHEVVCGDLLSAFNEEVSVGHAPLISCSMRKGGGMKGGEGVSLPTKIHVIW